MADMKLVRRIERVPAVDPETGKQRPDLPEVEEIVDDYVPLDAEELAERAGWANDMAVGEARSKARDRTVAHYMDLLSGDFSEIRDFDESRVILRTIQQAVEETAQTIPYKRAIARHVYAEAKLVEIDAMSVAEADAYDPVNDVGWPT